MINNLFVEKTKLAKKLKNLANVFENYKTKKALLRQQQKEKKKCNACYDT